MRLLTDDERALLAGAVCIAAVLAVVPMSAQPRALAALVAAGALVWLSRGYYAAGGGSVSPTSYASTQQAAAEAAYEPDRGVGTGDILAAARGQTAQRKQPVQQKQRPRFAPLDAQLYTLRVPDVATSRAAWIDAPEAAARGQLRHLALRGRLMGVVRRAARLGARNGNSTSGVRAMAALEDFFSRYHRALLSSDAEYAARTLGTLRDTRAVALNALHDISLSVPIDLGERVLMATDAAREETLRCMSTLAAHHAPSGSPALAVADWSAPMPADVGAGRVLGDAGLLF
jgi:hypothetical protein